MTQRDFLDKTYPAPFGSSTEELASLMAEQTNYLADIALALKKQTADVLCYTQVERTSQLNNNIIDLLSHQINFMLAGKPVTIHRLLAFSTYDQNVVLNIQSQANAKDGIVFSATTPALFIPLSVESVYLQAAALGGTTLPVNGPPDSTHGGFFLYGFTIPDYYDIRGASRS